FSLFNTNHSFLYVCTVIVVLFIISESIFFLVKAWRRAKELNIDKKALKKIAASSAVFTIAPAIAILLGVITLSKALGLPFPWLRLSVIGALTYELPAAEAAATAVGASISSIVTDPKIFTTIAWVMTLGILPGITLLPFIGKKIQSGVVKIKRKDEKWGELFMSSLFIGMIAAFLGVVFAKVNLGLVGWIPVFVMIAAAVVMVICAFFIKVLKWDWLTDFALPISMLSAMALSIPITNVVNSVVGG
ncbi:MAG: DUF5058 family protein, partial [Oscillospiraceae bacterium]